jgi:hypothetical protein
VENISQLLAQMLQIFGRVGQAASTQVVNIGSIKYITAASKNTLVSVSVVFDILSAMWQTERQTLKKLLLSLCTPTVSFLFGD